MLRHARTNFSFLSLSLLIGVLTAGCTPNKKGPDGDAKVINRKTNCYLYVHGRDSIKLALLEGDSNVSGSLVFSFYEKDKNTGTVEGYFRGDTLFADYTFTSEGMLSFREVAFLKRHGSYVLGSGEIVNSGNRDVIKDPHAIDFGGKTVLQPAACK